jgi:hypothetical protein
MALLKAEEKELLTKTINLIDELLETIEIIQDKELVKNLKMALRDVEECKAKPLDELVRKLNLESEI